MSDYVLPNLLGKPRFQKQLRAHREAAPLNFNLILGLPYASLQDNVLREYVRIGEDYVAYCLSAKFPLVPISYTAFTGYFVRAFRKGFTTRSFAGMACKIKWYFTNVLHAEPLDMRDPVGYQAYLRAIRALKKMDHTVAKKKSPLYMAIIRRLATVADGSAFEDMIITILAFQNRCMQRLGELVDGSAKIHHLRHFEHMDFGPFFVFYYLDNNPAKAHKMKNAPFAIVSKRNSPFAYMRMIQFINAVHANSPQDAFLFPHVNKEDKFEYQRSLSKSQVIKCMELLLTRAGFNSANYGGQSARRGGFLDRHDVPLFLACVQGHWSPESLTAQREYGHQSLTQRLTYF